MVLARVRRAAFLTEVASFHEWRKVARIFAAFFVDVDELLAKLLEIAEAFPHDYLLRGEIFSLDSARTGGLLPNRSNSFRCSSKRPFRRRTFYVSFIRKGASLTLSVILYAV